MLAKKIRTEYMKKFKDPKWETFSKCYEDSLKYRLTRRVMEHAHKPWIWDGWDSGSDSSGRSTPKNKVSPLNFTSPPLSDCKNDRVSSPEPKETSESKTLVENGIAEFDLRDALPCSEPIMENGLNGHDAGLKNKMASINKISPMNNGLSDETDEGPANKETSDDEPIRAPPKHRHRHRASRSEPGYRDCSHDDKQPVNRKPSRAKSQPPASRRKASCRHDWTERHVESSSRRTPNEGRTSDASVQTRRESDKRGSNLDRRRAKSADLEKLQRSELTVAKDDRWMTEYMRCFSARLR